MSNKKRPAPCEGTTCSGGDCFRCGWNPHEAKRRKALIKENGLTKIGDTRRLIIIGRKKK